GDRTILSRVGRQCSAKDSDRCEAQQDVLQACSHVYKSTTDGAGFRYNRKPCHARESLCLTYGAVVRCDRTSGASAGVSRMLVEHKEVHMSPSRVSLATVSRSKFLFALFLFASAGGRPPGAATNAKQTAAAPAAATATRQSSLERSLTGRRRSHGRQR